MMNPKSLPAIDESDLKQCSGCGKHLVEKGPTFWIGEISRGVLDAQGLKERVGLTMMLGGSAALGSMFAASPAARRFDGPHKIVVCEQCACEMPLAVLAMKEDADGR